MMTLPSVRVKRYWTLGHGHDDGLVELPLQPLLDDLQVQQPEKAAAEALAQGGGGILLIDQGGVVELVFFQGVGQGLVIVGGDRVDGGEDHGLHFLEAGQRRGRGRASRVMVSPIRVSLTVLMPAMI